MPSALRPKVRLFNLSPDTSVAGMDLRSALNASIHVPLAKNVAFSLGSSWSEIPTGMQTYSISDDGHTPPTKLTTVKVKSPLAPLGFTNMLLCLQGAPGALGVKVVALADAPEGGVCKPTK